MTTFKEKMKDNRITIIRYICAVLVVVLHSANIGSWGLESLSVNDIGYRNLIFIEKVVSHICNLAVPTFFFISGYLGFKSYKKDLYWTKLKKSLFSLGIPYFLWSFLSYVYYAIGTNVLSAGPYLRGEKISFDIKSIIYGTVTSQCAPLWYLRNLFAFTLLSGIIYILLKKKYSIFIIVLLILLNFVKEFDYYGLIQWLPIYMLGAYVGIHRQEIDLKKKQYIFLTALLLVLSCVFAFIVQDYRTMFLYRVMSCFSVPMVLGTIIKKDVKINKCVGISLFIYCTHLPITTTFNKMCLVLFGNELIFATACYILSPILVIIIITCVAFVWERYFPKLWRIVNGGRG